MLFEKKLSIGVLGGSNLLDHIIYFENSGGFSTFQCEFCFPQVLLEAEIKVKVSRDSNTLKTLWDENINTN